MRIPPRRADDAVVAVVLLRGHVAVASPIGLLCAPEAQVMGDGVRTVGVDGIRSQC